MRAEFRKLLLILLAMMLLLTGCAPQVPNDVETGNDEVDIPDAPEDNGGDDTSDDEEYDTPMTDNAFTLRYDPEKSLNPYTGANADNIAITGLMYEGLFSVDETFHAEPLLCESWESTNGKVYLITLKPGLTFSDGTPLTAKDVVYSITRARNGGRFMSRLSIVVSTVAVSDEKISITLSKPNYDFLVLLDVPIVKEGTAYDAIPIGTGPYSIRERSDGSRYLTKVDEHRHSRKLPLNTIFLKTVNETEIVDEFSTRGIDILRSGASGDAGYNIHVESDARFYDGTSLVYIGFNTKDTVMSNSGIRRALSYIIDREYIYNGIYGGNLRPAPVILSSALDYYDSAWESDIEYSLTKMSEIFATIGMEDFSGDGYLDYPIGNDWRVFETVLIVNKENPKRIEVAESVADSLRKVGINTVVQILPWAAYISALETGEFDIYIGEAQIQTDFDVSSLFTSGGELNYGKASATHYQTIIDEFLAATEETKAEKAKTLCDYVTSDSAVIPLVYQRYSVVTHRGAVTGMAPSQSNIFRNITNWTVNP